MDLKIRKRMVEEGNSQVCFKRQCELVNVSRGSMYYVPQKKNNDVAIVNELRDIYKRCPFYGYRRMTVALRQKGLMVNHKKVQRVLKVAGIKALYPTRNLSKRNLQHQIFPYLLRDIKIERPNQVWQVDITYIKIAGGFIYLICLKDVFSRKIMGAHLSTFLDTSSCLIALEKALKHGTPEIINSDQGCQFTSSVWIKSLMNHGITISMDGKGRWADNVYIERFWRTVKYEFVYLYCFDSVEQAEAALMRYIDFYNQQRFHQALNYHTPDFVYAKKSIPTKRELLESFILQQPYTARSIMF